MSGLRGVLGEGEMVRGREKEYRERREGRGKYRVFLDLGCQISVVSCTVCKGSGTVRVFDR